MYPHFIEVHDIRKPEDAMLINIDNIKHIYMEPTTNSGAISLVDKVFVPTSESYEELKQLIEDAGCQINRGDPRLDNKPLTKADIKKMGFGDPIWNSNSGKWYLLSTWCDLESGFLVTIFNEKETYHFDENDLVKFPIYRMKVSNGLVQ